MITMENTRELIDFEYYGKSYRMAPEEIEAAYRYQEMQYRKADALRMLTSYAFGIRRPFGMLTRVTYAAGVLWAARGSRQTASISARPRARLSLIRKSVVLRGSP